ncbi:hypothetical protein BKD03_16200 [Brucella sp. 09RB8471]|nr:hypothetical protein BKD03_16200 [Brucella sp. 09RB8471]
MARKYFRAVPVLKEPPEPLYLFILRIVPRKTASHFCWKCFKRAIAACGPFVKMHGKARAVAQAFEKIVLCVYISGALTVRSRWPRRSECR